MITLGTLLACCLLVATAAEPKNLDRVVTKALVLSNGLDWGNWGPAEYCEDGSFAMEFEVKFEPYSILNTDETAVNAVKLYCSTLELHPTGYILSSEGEKGEWQGMRVCENGFLTGMRAKVLAPRGVALDDVAVQDVMMECDYGDTVIIGVDSHARIPDGDWSTWARCPNGSAICGLETRLEDPNLVVDDTGITDISMYCCSLDGLRRRRQ
nr:vitelline membrane outer layer protein 1 homolog [Cherax quadricarinatus]